MYDSSLKYRWGNKAVLDYAIQESREQGREEGEHKKTITIARELKKKDLSIEFIAKITGLSVEEIKKL